LRLTIPQIEEVKGVTQILDIQEEISTQEFAKFEEKLKEQKGNLREQNLQ
jgi:anti-anti-sigma regulatory factor